LIFTLLNLFISRLLAFREEIMLIEVSSHVVFTSHKLRKITSYFIPIKWELLTSLDHSCSIIVLSYLLIYLTRAKVIIIIYLIVFNTNIFLSSDSIISIILYSLFDLIFGNTHWLILNEHIILRLRCVLLLLKHLALV
jgi:hypothetical protein